MTLGEKIKKYRLLKGLTQKELGIAVGFSNTTADSRIRKYESDLMAPKDQIRIKLADALGVDLSALSDIDIHSFEDVMQTLFLFEESWGMDIEKKDGKTYLVFDDKNQEIRTLITFMNIWKNQRTALLLNSENNGSKANEKTKNYEIWKSRFAQSIRSYFSSKEKEITKYYQHLVEQAEKSYPYTKKTSDLTLLLRRIIESGLTLSTISYTAIDEKGGPGFTFVVSQLLNPPSAESATLFARFLSELKHFADLGAEIQTEMQMLDKLLTITYHICVPSFIVIKNQIDDLIDYLSRSDHQNDFAKDSFERMFTDNLSSHYNYIEDEINQYRDR